ncbi:hypothetical protein GUJ93_ZPchr0002g26657 [Zizania palustris]|uniref:Uncharacterized protein n=1 Tax=Zizania palustris TaxID=103762 RepID=A0A8J5VV03_ZIZPA|nr:hypothetical protein GUJ93_ZPchr0002g26657 [Zizania palustris]
MAAVAARGRRCRGVVLLLLLASVVAPLGLYGGSYVSPLPDSTVARGLLDREGESNLVWSQVAAFDGLLSICLFGHTGVADLTIEKLDEHKNRALSATDDWQVVDAASKNRAFVKPDAGVRRKNPGSGDANEVITEGNDGAQSGQEVGEPGEINRTEEQNLEGIKDMKSDASEEEQNDRSGEAGVNNIPRMHTTMNSSVEKCK